MQPSKTSHLHYCLTSHLRCYLISHPWIPSHHSSQSPPSSRSPSPPPSPRLQLMPMAEVAPTEAALLLRGFSSAARADMTIVTVTAGKLVCCTISRITHHVLQHHSSFCVHDFIRSLRVSASALAGGGNGLHTFILSCFGGLSPRCRRHSHFRLVAHLPH